MSNTIKMSDFGHEIYDEVNNHIDYSSGDVVNLENIQIQMTNE